MAAKGVGDPCPCNNIGIMQLFHELKQKFPAVPDRVVSECIRQSCHDKAACERLLRRENQGYLMHSYPMALKLSVAGEEAPLPGKPCERCACKSHGHSEGDVPVTRFFSSSVSPGGLPPHVETNQSNCSSFSQTDDISSSQSRTNAQCLLQECVTPRQCQTRSSVSVQSSSTTYHHHQHHRPHPLDVRSVAVFAQPQPWSAPDMPLAFEPFSNPPPKGRTSLTVEPAPHFASTNYWGGATPSPSQHPRSYTSVNLTLRPPSLDPLPPIDIHSAGTSLTYSTSSYNPRQGFQSQLQIRIGPGGVGSASALRTRAPDARPRSCFMPSLEQREETPARAESLPDVASLSLHGGGESASQVAALLAQQMARKERLVRELKREKQKLCEMQLEVRDMEKDLAQRKRRQRENNLALPVVTSVLQKMQCLRHDIQDLQQECKKMDTEVQLTTVDPQADEAFYKNIYTGQRGCVLNRHQTANTHRRETRGPNPPLDALDLDGPNWTCTECTFRNHPLLDKCEQCEMPRIILGGETQDIHIHVTHHNFPARRVLHSWVV